MTQKNTLIFVVISVLLLALFYHLKNDAKEAYFEQKEQLVLFQKEAKEIGALKKRFKDKSMTRRLIASLERISKPTKDQSKSKVRVLVFENLGNNALNAILRKVENSGLKVKKLQIQRLDAQKAKVQLEIKK